MALDITARTDAEEALAASEALFRAAFENAPIGMALISPDWRLLAVNRADCELLGYTEDELLATTFLGATHPDDVAITRAVVARALAGEGDQYQLEKRYLRKDGQIIWVHLSVSLIRDEDGAPRYFISQAQDITTRKEAEADLAATQQRTRDVLERISDGFYALDRAWRFTYLNHAAERILDERRGALLGRVIWEAFPGLVDTPLSQAYQRVMNEGQATIFESYSDRLDRWFEVRAHPSPEGLSVFFCDITERKRVDDEIRAALEAARAAQRTTGQFLAMMSHELRTPLQAILGYADFLLHGPSGALTREQAEDIGYIEQGARRMSTLVDQMLDLSRIEAGRLQLVLEQVDLSQVIEQVRQDIAPQAAAKNLYLVIDVSPSPPLVQGDPVRLHQILLNLVSNAVKFTERGSVRVSVTEVDGGVDIAVSDTGIGIAAEALPHIFEAFRQADSTVNRRYGGAGLGLAIAKQLAELMGGRINVVSHLGDGSTFTLHLPTSKPRARRRSGRKR
jgi:PAS domain S-box-containing protein